MERAYVHMCNIGMYCKQVCKNWSIGIATVFLLWGTGFSPMDATASGTQSSSIGLITTNPTCHGSSDGSIEVDGIPPSTGICTPPTSSPTGCTGCSITLSGGGWNTINAGTTACVLAGQTYTGGINLNGGTLIVCGTLSPSSLGLNSGTMVVNGTLNINGWFNINGTSTLNNYGTIAISGGVGVNRNLFNYGSFTCASMSINSNSQFENHGTLTISGNYEDNFGSANYGVMAVSGNLTKNSNNQFTNHCTVTVGGQLTSNGPIHQNGTITANGALTVNSNGGLILGSGSFTSAASATLNGPINNPNSNCARVNIAGNTTINGNGSISGKTDFCDANGIETNYGSINSPATTNCSCSANGAGGSAVSYLWSNGATTPTITDLPVGNYSVTITMGADTEILNASLTAPALNLSATPTHTSGGNDNGAVAISASGGSTPYSYLWSNGSTNKDISGLAAGSYTITLTDNNGCTATASATINASQGPCTCIATGNWSSASTWSGNCSGGGGKYAGHLDDIEIKGHQVTVDSAHTVKSLIMKESGSGVSRLTFTNSNRLNVLEDFNITTTGNGNNVEVKIEGSADFVVHGDFKVNHTKGSSVLVHLNSANGNNAKLWVHGNLDMTMATGSGSLLVHAYAANDTIQVNGDILFKNNHTSSSAKMTITMASSSKLIVPGNINFNGVRNQNMELILNNSSTMELGGNVIRKASPSKFGKITINSTSSLVFNGSEQQIWETTTGNTDNNTYRNVIIRNTSPTSPQVVLNGNVTVTGTLTLQQGNVGTGSNMLILSNTSASALSGHSANSYIVGTLRRHIANNTASYDFPLGYGAPHEYYWARIKNANMVGPSHLTATFRELPAHERNSTITVSDADITYTEVHPAGIWTIDPNTQPLLGSYSIEVGTENFEGLMDNSFRIIKRPTNGGVQAWSNGSGLLSVLGAVDRLANTGRTSLGNLTSFSDFGIAQGNGSSLPIDLVSFGAKPDGEKVRLDWTVSMEINNDYFTIERSLDGEIFEPIVVVEGAGNHSEEKDYQAFDEQPYLGLAYYRLRQTDIDGATKAYDMVSVTMTTQATTKFDIVPNPNKGSFTIHLDTPYDQINVMVLNSMGQLVYLNDLLGTTGKTKTQLNLGDVLAPGIYFVKIDSGRDTFIKQMMIE